MWGWVILVGVVLAAVAGQLWKMHSRKRPVAPAASPDLHQIQAQLDELGQRASRAAAEQGPHGLGL